MTAPDQIAVDLDHLYDAGGFDRLLQTLHEAGQSGDPSVVPTLINLLDHPSARPGPQGKSRSVKGAAGEALRALGLLALPGLRDALSAHPDVASAAVHLLGEMQGEEVDEILLSALSHSSAKVRWMAAGRLGTRRVSAAIPALSELLVDPDPDVLRNVIWALGLIGDPSVIPTLEALSVSGEAKGARLIALGRLGVPSVRQPLLALLAKTNDDTLASQCADALAKLGPESVAPLSALLEGGKHAPIEQHIARTLRALGGEEAKAALARWKKVASDPG